MSTRIDHRFAALAGAGRCGLVTFLMAGDPDPETSFAIIEALPQAGADVIEIGMPFTDPMADGPAIQAAGLRALHAGQTMVKTLDLVRRFRRSDDTTPIVLMGYYNPIYIYGVKRFLADAVAAGVDGLIVVDLPPEEDTELCLPALAAGLNFIRLATPTTDDRRLPAVLRTPPDSFIMSRSPGSPARRRRTRGGWRRRWPGSSATPGFRSRSASGSRMRRAPPSSRVAPREWW